ncbi:hypothetical protein VTO42DRAFT_2668 [Malbranchea cinnamomea]
MPYFTRSAALALVQTSASTVTPTTTAEIPRKNSSVFASSDTTRDVFELPPRKAKRKNGPSTSQEQICKSARKGPAAGVDSGYSNEAVELPHNLGRVRVRQSITSTPVIETEDCIASGIRSGHSSHEFVTDVENYITPDIKIEDEVSVATATSRKAGNKTPKVPRAPYGLTPGVSPFPDWPHPTPEECEEVNRLLSEQHREVRAPAAIPPPSLTVSGCGEVPSILDALLRTVLSGATTKGNSDKALEGLVSRFGVTDKGIGKGSVNWDKVRQASLEDVEQAIKAGGLARIKSKNIKLILDMVYEENLKRREQLRKTKQRRNSSSAMSETDKYEAAELEDDLLSLNHLHCMSKDEAMLEFVKYPGIGVKTAACVILFCLQRPCFAVDTHVFRLSRWLKWLPPQDKRVDEITAFRHLDVKVPDHLKYSLHQLFLEHGKTCQRCRASTRDYSEVRCPLDHLVERTGKRKGKVAFRQTQLMLKLKTGSKPKKNESSS